MTEQEMRDSEVKKVTTIEELSSYIAELVNQKHDYGTCVYAMSMAAVATFYYVAHKLGVTGFQAGCADLDFLRRTRRMDNFKILDLENLLFPQYQDKFKSYEELIKENKSWLSKEAEKRLAANPDAHPDVIKHWKELATTNKEILNNKANQIGPVTIWQHNRTGGKRYDYSFERFMILISIALILFIYGFFVWF